MVILKAKNGTLESFFSIIIKRLKMERRLSLYILTILFLIMANIALLVLNLKLPALLLSIILLVPFILMIRCVIKQLEHKDTRSQELQQLIEQKDAYLSDFSHRIRTPLNNFSFIIEYLIDQKPEGNHKEMLETLIASTTNMVEAVNDLTVKSARDISYEPRKSISFNLDSAIRSTIDLLSANKGSNIKFSILSSDNVSKSYIGDPITIKQIFLDIFTTLQANDDTDINTEVKIDSEPIGTKKEIIKVVIIADIELPDFDAEKYPEGNINSMAIKLISGLKGSYETTVSNGISEFRFSIPLEVSTEEERQSKAAERIKELKTESKKKKTLAEANILLVEDNPTNQKIVMITLRSLVKNIDTATTGKEALDKFGKSAYDAILMDIQLPIMDGITAAAKIRELEQSTSIHTPIIAITANAMIGDKEKCLSAGMDDYLSKPFQPSQLINILESFVTR